MKRSAAIVPRIRLTLTAVAVICLPVLAACSMQSPIQTAMPYQPADGVAARSGAVEARDLLIVAAKKDGPGVISGSLINTGTDPVPVSLLSRAQADAGSGQGTTVQLKGREQKRLEGTQLPKVEAAPGDMTDLVIQTPAGRTLVSVPVLLPSGPYATLTATASSTAPTTPQTGTPTTSASASATPSAKTPTVNATSGTATPGG